MPLKNKSKWREGRAAYAMILPAVLIIAAVALWPLLRSFWISLFDLRLNDPTRNAIHYSYSMNVEQYADRFPSLLRAVKREAGSAEGSSSSGLAAAMKKLEDVGGELKEDPAFQERLTKVNALLDAFAPVPQELRFIPVDNAKAERLKTELQEIRKELAGLKEGGALTRPDEVIGLTSALLDTFQAPNFAGLSHYRELLSGRRLWESLGHTLLFTVFAVALEMLFGLLIALLLNRTFRGRGLVRAAVLIPWATPTAVSAMIWHYLYDGQNGIVAKLLYEAGLISDMATLLSSGSWVMGSVIMADVWKTAPLVALLLLAGLQNIPASLYEAAWVDGGSRWKQFVHVTVPLLKPAFFVALMFRTLDAFRVFDLIYVLTGGGPANSTESVSIYAYKTMFSELDFGKGSALSVIVFVCVLLISMA
ncbi:carbohydrate ABC transporter permease, partial [Paenibacillus forsythiae]